VWYSPGGPPAFGDRFYWRIRHRNGNILVSSQGYVRKATRDRIARALAESSGWDVKEGK
jgi:hypothetical protein